MASGAYCVRKFNQKRSMHNKDRFLYYFVRIRDKLTIPDAAKRMGVAIATWRSWENHRTDMAQSFWPQFNQAFGIKLDPDNVGGPMHADDILHYIRLLDEMQAEQAAKAITLRRAKGPRLKPFLFKRRQALIEDTRAACKAMRRTLSQYDCADVSNSTLADWQRWESGRAPATRKQIETIIERTPT